MAPEQLAGLRGDALSDQFSFGVSLYEALCGERPFGGRNLEELMAARAQPPKPPARPLPRWLLRALLRSLSPDRQARFPSLPALIAHLETHLARPRRWALAASLAALLVGVGLLVRTQLPQPDRSCRIETRRLAALWEPDKFAPRARASDDFAALDRAVHSYIADWVTVRVGACEGADAVDPAERARFALRIACLDERRQELSSLLSRPTAGEDLGSTLQRLGALSAPQACMLK
jgi:hypothetical protein